MHGAQLTNAVFMPDASALVEVFGCGHFSDTYRKLNLGACVSGAFAVLAYLWSIRLSSSPKLWFLLVPALALHGVQACVCYGGIRAGATK